MQNNKTISQNSSHQSKVRQYCTQENQFYNQEQNIQSFNYDDRYSTNQFNQQQGYFNENQQKHQGYNISEKRYENIKNREEPNSNKQFLNQNTHNFPNTSPQFSNENFKNNLQQKKTFKEENQVEYKEQKLTHQSKISQQSNVIDGRQIQQTKNVKQNDQNNQQNNQQFYNSSINSQLSKIKTGLPNLGMTCYINSAVQQLKQFYYIDKTIFDSSSFGQHFKDLFNHLENRNSIYVFRIIENIVNMAKQQQKHSQGGDAYMCIYNFLNQIKKSLPSNEKEKFNKNFLLKYSDQLECKNCKKKIENTINQYTFEQYEEFGQECSQLSQAFSCQGNQNLFLEVNPEIICETCGKRDLQTKREYQLAPNFMMVRLLMSDYQPYQIYSNNNFLEQQFTLSVQGQKFPQKYQIIGFCNHDQDHYKYFAKYEMEWIEFNDNFVYQIYYPDCSNALYYVLQKVQNNTAESEQQQSQQLSQQSTNLKQINFVKNKQFCDNIYQEFNINKQINPDIPYQQEVQKYSNKNKNNFNENTQQKIEKIEQEHNQQQQNIFNNKYESFVNACQILPNLEDKQYAIPVIQALIQIYFYFDEILFEPSTPKNEDFQTLIQLIKLQEPRNIKDMLQNIFIKDKQYQKSEESYSYFCDLLLEVFSTLDCTQKNKFVSNFIIKFKFQGQCQKCQAKYETEEFLTYEQQQIHYNMLNDNFSNNNDQNTQKLFLSCNYCKQRYQICKRIYTEAPNFIIFKPNSEKLNQQLSTQINNVFQHSLYQNKTESYKIIGFCSYSNQQYSYTAKCQDSWVKIQNQKAQYQTTPNCSKAQYFILQKQVQN